MREFYLIDEKSYCPKCKEVVDVEEWEDKNTGHTEQRCSGCRNENLEEIITCEICEKPMNGNRAKSGLCICSDCLSDIDHAIDKAVELIKKNRKMSYFTAEGYLLDRLKETED